MLLVHHARKGTAHCARRPALAAPRAARPGRLKPLPAPPRPQARLSVHRAAPGHDRLVLELRACAGMRSLSFASTPSDFLDSCSSTLPTVLTPWESSGTRALRNGGSSAQGGVSLNAENAWRSALVALGQPGEAGYAARRRYRCCSPPTSASAASERSHFPEVSPWRELRSGFAVRLLQLRDVELDHLEHRVRHPLRADRILVSHHLHQHRRNDLPPQTEAIDQPAAGLRLPSIAQDADQFRSSSA